MQKQILKMAKITKNAKIAIFFHRKSNLFFEYLLMTVKDNPEIFCGCSVCCWDWLKTFKTGGKGVARGVFLSMLVSGSPLAVVYSLLASQLWDPVARPKIAKFFLKSTYISPKSCIFCKKNSRQIWEIEIFDPWPLTQTTNVALDV